MYLNRIALASIFECDIVIYREHDFRTLVTNESIVSRHEIRVVYRGPVNRWNHYDSFLHFIDEFGNRYRESVNVPVKAVRDEW